jgi:ABC-type nitrate/sulfonate/bicarbonate transport system ATPase subunit
MKIEQLTFAYGEKLVFDRLTLALPDEGVTALSGPSGCGKTSLLRLIAGLETAQGGHLEVPNPHCCAILFQENRLLPGLTAARQLLPVLRKGEDPQDYLRLVGLEEERNSPVSALSGGMQRRVALARLMAYGRDKELLLLDEPFTGIDPPRAAQIMEELRRMEIPILLAAHDRETLALADRVIQLNQA